MSDNGPQYSSEQFTDFADQYDFTHITSSPKYPQSNGTAERAVRTIKELLTKNNTGGGDIYMAILAYRSTPLENGLSPAELLMNRKLRTTVPMIPQELKPKLPNSHQLRKKESRKKQKMYYDKRHRVRRLKTLKSGEAVWVPEMRKKARVIRRQGIRSYLIRTDDGSTYRRNQKQLNWIPKANHPATGDGSAPEDVTNIPSVEPAIAVLTENSSATQSQGDNSLPYQTRSGRSV